MRRRGCAMEVMLMRGREEMKISSNPTSPKSSGMEIPCSSMHCQAPSATMPGRENDDELTLFESVGTAVLDIVTAQRIYERAEEMNVGSVIEL